MPFVFIYVVARDFGFAPNPFHGTCSLATCKPKIRNVASVEDWIIGVGGKNLRANGKCIFGMKVTKKLSFNDYYQCQEYQDKKPVRNGSKKMLLGDNIYWYNSETKIWTQADSHHSNIDGSINEYNRDRDTQSEKVLLSKNFYYFGSKAPDIPPNILNVLNYTNRQGHRKYRLEEAKDLINWLENNYQANLNLVTADPFNFDNSSAHYSVQTDKVT